MEGDERVVILIAAGYSDGFRTIGNYAGRDAMPGEKNPDPRRIGFHQHQAVRQRSGPVFRQ